MSLSDESTRVNYPMRNIGWRLNTICRGNGKALPPTHRQQGHDPGTAQPFATTS